MIETITAALAVGTIWFWLLVTIISVIIIACVENEHYPLPTISLFAFGAIYWKEIMIAPWQTIATILAVFAVGGILWSIFKWHQKVNRTVAKYKDRFGDTLSAGAMNDLKREISVSNNKALLTGWIAFWPWSLLWTLTGDFFNMLYEAMQNVYQSITNRGLSKFVVKESENPKSKQPEDPLEVFRNR